MKRGIGYHVYTYQDRDGMWWRCDQGMRPVDSLSDRLSRVLADSVRADDVQSPAVAEPKKNSVSEILEGLGRRACRKDQ